MTCFADDSTYTGARKDCNELQTLHNRKFKKMDEFLTQNRLKINQDKTHFTLQVTDRKLKNNPDLKELKLTAGTNLVEQSEQELHPEFQHMWEGSAKISTQLRPYPR